MIKISQQSLLRISTITIKNFRSFYGEREPIELSVEAEHPVTIFHGTSGRGKTTLLNAIHWCIYNREGKIKQKKTSSEGLVHSCTIESLRQGEEDDMSVEILIENENHMIEYEIKREIKIKKSTKGGEDSWNPILLAKVSPSIEATQNVSFAYRDPDTDDVRNISSKDDSNKIDNINERIEKIFPNVLSSYILFDAELLRKFEEQQESGMIQEGIETITGLPIIEDAATMLEKIGKKITKTGIGETIKFQACDTKIKRLETAIEKLEKDNEEKGKKILEMAEDEEKRIKFNLENDDEAVAEAQKRQIELENQVSGLADNIRKTKKEMRDSIFGNLVNYYLHDSLLVSQKKLENWRNKGLVPSRFTKEALQGLLDDKMCVCGRGLKQEHDHEIGSIKDIMAKVYEAAIASEMGRISDDIDEVINNSDDENSDKILENYKNLELALSKARDKRIELKSTLTKLQNDVDPDLQDKVSVNRRELTKIRSDMDRLKGSIAKNGRDLDVYEPELKIQQKEFDKMQKSVIKDDVNGNKISLSIYANSILKQTSEYLEKFFKTNVEAATQEYFLKTAPDKEQFSGVKISDETYEISALRKGDKEKEISQGQAHCLGLSYIAGIRKVTSKNYFMMVDSPFHNISQESKLQVCVELPTKMDTTQVTFFCTDTEYRSKIPSDKFGGELASAKEVLIKNNLIGLQYNLKIEKFENNGTEYQKTVISKVGLDD